MSILDGIAGRPEHQGLTAMLLGAQQQPAAQPQQTGITGFLQNAQSPGAMATQPPHDTHPKLRRIIGIIGDALAGFNGQPGPYAAAMWKRRDLQDQSQSELQQSILKHQLDTQYPSPSTAARMAAEIGLQPGTPKYMQFISRYAFTPRIVGIPNAMGGTDQVDVSGYDSGDSGDGRAVVRTGTDASGRRVNQYSDGSIDYAD